MCRRRSGMARLGQRDEAVAERGPARPVGVGALPGVDVLAHRGREPGARFGMRDQRRHLHGGIAGRRRRRIDERRQHDLHAHALVGLDDMSGLMSGTKSTARCTRKAEHAGSMRVDLGAEVAGQLRGIDHLEEGSLVVGVRDHGRGADALAVASSMPAALPFSTRMRLTGDFRRTEPPRRRTTSASTSAKRHDPALGVDAAVKIVAVDRNHVGNRQGLRAIGDVAGEAATPASGRPDRRRRRREIPRTTGPSSGRRADSAWGRRAAPRWNR